MAQSPRQEPAPDGPEFDGGLPSGYVVVVLAADVDVDDLGELGTDPDFAALVAELGELGDPANRRLVNRAAGDDVRELEERAQRRRRRDRRTSLTRFWRIDVRGRADPAEFARRLAGLNGVETAYAESRVAPAPGLSARPASAVAMLTQGYLDPRPHGVDARFAWTRLGGRGEEVRLVDVEQGWRLAHPAYAAHAPTVLPDPDRLNRDGLGVFVGDHGTATFAVVAATGSTTRTLGVAPEIASLRACSHYDATRDEELHVMPAIVQAAAALRLGDVLLLEVQRLGSNGKELPTEVDLADFVAIQDATDAGIVVVEAAGNGPRDLDRWRPPPAVAERRLERDHPDFDSGAVLVGGCIKALHQDGHKRHPESNFGKRVDCYAWGEGVASANATPTTATWTDRFSGTSAASAIVAGVAVVAQGMNLAAGQEALPAEEIRDLLSASTGTAQTPSSEPKRIGVMPDLRRIAAAVGSLPRPGTG